MRFKILMAVVALALAAYAVFWFIAADRVEARVLAWIAKEKAAGNDIRYRDLEIGGFPYRLEVSFTDFHAIGGASDGQWLVDVPKLTGVVLPWKPRHAILIADHVSAELTPVGGEGEQSSAEGLRASVIVDKGGDIERLSVTAQSIALRGASIGGPGFAATAAEFHWRAGNQGPRRSPLAEADQEETVQERLVWQVALKAKNIVDPRLARSPYGDTIAELAVILELHGMGLGPESSAASVAAWRDSGGTVEVPSFTLQWGQLDLMLLGSATLDQQFRPLGAFTAQVKGYEPVVDSLEAKGNISHEEAIAAKETLKSIENGDRGRLPVPVTMQAGRMFLGPLPVANLPPLIAPPLPTPEPPL